MRRSDDEVRRHREAWELIPWVVNGRADAEERRRLEAHLRDCADCRCEYQLQLRLRDALRDDTAPVRDPKPALHRLWARIDGTTLPRGAVRARSPARWLVGGLLAAVVGEAIGLAALGLAVWDQAAAPRYATLATPRAALPAPTIEAVFAPTLTTGALQELLARSRLRIDDGPDLAGVYSLGPAAHPLPTARALAILRANPAVRLAEPLATAPVLTR